MEILVQRKWQTRKEKRVSTQCETNENIEPEHDLNDEQKDDDSVDRIDEPVQANKSEIRSHLVLQKVTKKPLMRLSD